MGFLGRGQQPPSLYQLGGLERCELPSEVQKRIPDCSAVFHYFQHSGWHLLLLIVDYHAAIGGKTAVVPLAYASGLLLLNYTKARGDDQAS